ncbi:hypothetical protein EV356DRAFT_542742, partial [Viridothelium virens]
MQVSQITGAPNLIVINVYNKAYLRGFAPNTYPLAIKDEYVKDTPRFSRLCKDNPKIVESICKKKKVEISIAVRKPV